MLLLIKRNIKLWLINLNKCNNKNHKLIILIKRVLKIYLNWMNKFINLKKNKWKRLNFYLNKKNRL